MALKYRREIDGLRAIAVIAVLVYHAELNFGGSILLSGGFIGVDIFFVISGFLITAIILREQQGEGFSYLRFYERRARRILPVLFAVLLASAIAGWFLMMPQALKEFAASGLSSVFFSSNIFFWMEDSYTAQASALKPLLHTWTLSLEEQFYIFFPILLGIVYRFARRFVLHFLVATLLLSLLVAHATSAIWPDAAFYLLPARGWELLAGSVLAKLELDYGRSPGKLTSAVFPPLGLAMICFAIIAFHDDMRHPSFITAIPIVGTMLIIWFARPGELITRLLSSGIMVGIGLISYSVYLWHFPLFAFARIHYGELDHTFAVAIMGASILLGVASFYLIEKTTRRSTALGRKTFFSGLLMVSIMTVGIYGYFYQSGGAQQRTGDASQLFEGLRAGNLAKLDGMVCDRAAKLPLCKALIPGATENLVVVGDSHAQAIAPAFLELAQANNLNFYVLATAGCPHVVGTYSVINGKKTKPGCDAEYSIARQKFLTDLKPSTIVYSNNFPYYMERENYDNQEGGHYVTDRSITSEVSDLPEFQNQTWDELLKATLNTLLENQHRVVLVYPIPEAGWNVPDEVAARLNSKDNDEKLAAFDAMELTTSYRSFLNRAGSARRLLNEIQDQPNLLRIMPDRLLCSRKSGRCANVSDKHILYFDHNHLSVFGARLLANYVAEEMNLKRLDIGKERVRN
ncbi:acyltransferase family protein [Henriciella litoralis]|uniref:acyltransferase family protein n=1 Tax=Henriciella litoralis TaxID=568102 RepID=UPI000A06713B|nr:acyltransferase family protein [Henriciella litoralis]